MIGNLERQRRLVGKSVPSLHGIDAFPHICDVIDTVPHVEINDKVRAMAMQAGNLKGVTEYFADRRRR